VAASQAINRALRLNPRSPYGILAIVAWVNYGAGRTEKAAELFERVRATSPDLIIARVPLAAIYEAEGRHDESRQMVEEILRASPDLTAQVLVDEMIGLFPFDPERKEKFMDDLKKAGLP
jgi:cytochrome c-type biogenesis protein CcmH/NrfG